MEPLLIMSQNLLCADHGEDNTVDQRAVRFARLFGEIRPDLLGTQETTAKWNGLLSGAIGEEYGMIGVSRDGREAQSGEWNTIFYRKARFELLDSDTFWLTGTPTETGKVEGSLCTRICTWAYLLDRDSGRKLLFANTHLDHGKDEIRQVQAEYLMKALRRFLGKVPVFLTGDFNALPGSLPYQTVNDKLDDAHISCGEDLSEVGFTFHGFGRCEHEIDFVFFDGRKADCESYRIRDDKFDGYISDHNGVTASFILK